MRLTPALAAHRHLLLLHHSSLLGSPQLLSLLCGKVQLQLSLLPLLLRGPQLLLQLLHAACTQDMQQPSQNPPADTATTAVTRR